MHFLRPIARRLDGEGANRGAVATVDDLDEEERAHYEAGTTAFDNGDFYGAHDHFEALWGEDFWKGLVQASVALHHHRIGNPRGLEGLPESVRRILAPYEPSYMGIDVRQLLQAFDTYLQEVPLGEEAPASLRPRLRTASSP